jgi:hypothetical protein
VPLKQEGHLIQFDNLKQEEQYLQNHHLVVSLNIEDMNVSNQKTKKQKQLIE